MDQAHAPDAGHHGGLSYFQVFLILMVVTVAEVGVAYLDIDKSVKIVTFVVMALYKAVMVAAYFMHLRFEKPLMWVIASAPLILGVIIAVGAYPDSEKGTQRFKDGVLDPWSESDGEAPHGATPNDAAPKTDSPKEAGPAGSQR